MSDGLNAKVYCFRKSDGRKLWIHAATMALANGERRELLGVRASDNEADAAIYSFDDAAQIVRFLASPAKLIDGSEIDRGVRDPYALLVVAEAAA